MLMPTWRDKTPFVGPFGKVVFVNPCQGVIVGGSGTILTTTDGGAAWIKRESGTDVTLRGVAAIGSKHIWAVGDDGTIVYSVDGGDSFTVTQPSITTELFESVFFVDPDNGWVVGSNGTILATKDGGSMWNDQTKNNTYGLNHVVFLDDKVTGWAVGNGVILHTTDGGGTWNIQHETPAQLFEVAFPDAMNGYAVGRVFNDDGISSIGKILITKDGGTTWNETIWLDDSGNPVSSFFGVSFVDADTGWAVGTEDTILRTINGGETWTLEWRVGPTARNLVGVAFPDPCTAYATAANTILKYCCK
ncbi:hypothetical protein VU07_00615 [Desulfobulbus sp. F4]|nr:hypothetical protein [Desulfobulbus sp. F4]